MMKLRIMTEKKLNTVIQEKVDAAVAEINRDYEREVLLKQANLKTLQSQINPHFLYNTLECIRGMALEKNEENIADITLSLSRFFRYSISGKTDTVSLRDELENCRIYAKIQNYRFRNRFSIRIEEKGRVLDAAIPKLTLQPIIENSILHGLQDMLSDGEIVIRSERVGDLVDIMISDNGCGMSPEALKKLSDTILGGEKNSPEGRHSGVAMSNVDRRLKLFFGAQYGLSVFSVEGMGTDVELRIPYIPVKNE